MSDKLERQVVKNGGAKGSTKEDAIRRTIFIGGIPLQTTHKQILSYLANYDFIENIKLPKDYSTGKIKGFAKVVLGSTKGVERVLAEDDHFIGGLKVGISRWRDSLEYLNNKEDQGKRKIFVKYPPGLSPDTLRKYFYQFGELQEIDHKRDPETNKDRYFCYILFDSLESVQAVLEKGEHWVGKNLVICELSKPQYSDKVCAKPSSKFNNSAAPRQHHQLEEGIWASQLKTPVFFEQIKSKTSETQHRPSAMTEKLKTSKLKTTDTTNTKSVNMVSGNIIPKHFKMQSGYINQYQDYGRYHAQNLCQPLPREISSVRNDMPSGKPNLTNESEIEERKTKRRFSQYILERVSQNHNVRHNVKFTRTRISSHMYTPT